MLKTGGKENTGKSAEGVDQPLIHAGESRIPNVWRLA
jgi:hypothetical protein